jgi:hypothetical protein
MKGLQVVDFQISPFPLKHFWCILFDDNLSKSGEKCSQMQVFLVKT